MFRSTVIAIFAPDRSLAHLRHVLSAEGEIVTAKSWYDLDEIIRREAVDVVVADPCADGELRPDEISRLVKQFPSLPLIAYVGVAAPQMRAILDLSKTGLEHVVFHRYEDSNPRFAALISSVRGDPLARRMLGEIMPLLSRLPLALTAAIQTMFEHPHRFSTVLDLGASAGIPSVRLYRSFDIAGFESPRRLIIAAKLLRGSAYLRNPGYSIANVATKVGYKYSRKFTRHCMTVLGMYPAKVRKHLGESQCVALIGNWLHASHPEPEIATTQIRGAGPYL